MPLLLFPPPSVSAKAASGRTIVREYSGIIINQNHKPESNSDFLPLTETPYWQTFFLPKDFRRGEEDGIKIPDLTGLQVYVGVDAGYGPVATIDWIIDHYIPEVGWTRLTSGTSVGAPSDGDELWLTINFDSPVEIEQDWLTDRFRFGIAGRSASGVLHEAVPYDGTTATINGIGVNVKPSIAAGGLEEGKIYPFSFAGTPALLELVAGTVYYSEQQGVNRLWYSAPNPLSTTFDKAYQADGQTVIQDSSRDVSLMFRVLADTADSGTDFLGDLYRAAVIRDEANNVGTSSKNLRDKYWLSKPNPSRFGVESLYFDLREGGDAVVVDRIMVDPLTPNVFFHVYYSNDDGGPGHDPDAWDSLLWTPIGTSYKMVNQQTFAFPEPVIGKYFKVEFSHLQAHYYAPGHFQKPLLYHRHPSWVFNYFYDGYLSHQVSDPLIGKQVQVNFDALDLGYQYPDDDIHSEPNPPNLIRIKANPGKGNKKTILVSLATIQLIKTTFRPFLNKPGLRGQHDLLVGIFARRLNFNNTNYPTEVIPKPKPDTSVVSSPDRESLITEKSFPVMWFYLTARHAYRLAVATFENDRAYFVGVKEIAFLRERYNALSDEDLYIENAGDNFNVERNDFETVDSTWVTYTP